MYERVVAPDRTLQSVWRYLSEERLIDLLETEELFFCHLPKLSDGLEGALTERTRLRLMKFLSEHYPPSTLHAMADDFERAREEFFVNCWHMNDHESYLMWRVYAERGFAIQSTIERLQAKFEEFPGVVRGEPVKYIDYSRDGFPFGNSFTAVGYKDLPYKDEREFRLMFWRPGRENKGVVVGEKGVRVKVDVSMLIESIYLSPQTEVPSERLVSLLKRHALLNVRSSVRIKPD